MKEKSAGRVYSVVSQMPEFPRGGMKAFVNYLKRNLVYPPQALRDSIEGVVAVQFVVETNGEITSPVIVRHLEASMDTAALTAIRNMPRWIPGKENGRAVRCKYSVPVQFKIPRKAPEPKETPRPQRYFEPYGITATSGTSPGFAEERFAAPSPDRQHPSACPSSENGQ